MNIYAVSAVPNMSLESGRIPRELLVFSPQWNLENVGSSLSKGNSHQRIYELASESEDKQTKSQSFLLPYPFMWGAIEGVA